MVTRNMDYYNLDMIINPIKSRIKIIFLIRATTSAERYCYEEQKIKNGYPLLYYISFFDVRYNEEIFFLFTDTFERQSCGYWTRYSLEDSNVLVEREDGRLYIILCRITSRRNGIDIR